MPEVVLCYPGLNAVWVHHLAHWLWEHGVLPDLVDAKLSSVVARLDAVEQQLEFET